MTSTLMTSTGSWIRSRLRRDRASSAPSARSNPTARQRRNHSRNFSRQFSWRFPNMTDITCGTRRPPFVGVVAPNDPNVLGAKHSLLVDLQYSTLRTSRFKGYVKEIWPGQCPSWWFRTPTGSWIRSRLRRPTFAFGAVRTQLHCGASKSRDFTGQNLPMTKVTSSPRAYLAEKLAHESCAKIRHDDAHVLAL